MLSMARQGWVCVTPNYQLSPKVVFPQHLLDLKLAVKWVHEHGEEHGADPSCIVVSGASAGGHLASLLALTANDPAYQPGFEDVDTSVAGCVSWYGVYDMTNRLHVRSRGFVRFVERTVFKQRLGRAPEAFAAYSPMDLVHPDVPPFMVIAGDRDTLVPVEEARHFSSLLRATSRQPVVYAELPGAQHAFEIFWSVRTVHAVAGAARFCEAVRLAAAATTDRKAS
jgi:acetyl esterase/lipase